MRAPWLGSQQVILCYTCCDWIGVSSLCRATESATGALQNLSMTHATHQLTCCPLDNNPRYSCCALPDQATLHNEQHRHLQGCNAPTETTAHSPRCRRIKNPTPTWQGSGAPSLSRPKTIPRTPRFLYAVRVSISFAHEADYSLAPPWIQAGTLSPPGILRASS